MRSNAAPMLAAEPKYTSWRNPLKVPQRVDLTMEGRPRRIVWAPGETKEVSSMYDDSIQKVVNGVIVGGLAPALINESLPADSRPLLHEALDGALHERREREARAAAAALQVRAAQDLALIAEARATEPEIKPAKK